MHQHERRTRLGADTGEIGVAQAGDVVDDRGAGGDRGGGDRRLVRIHGDDRLKGVGDPLHERDDALDLLLDGHGRHSRAR